MADKRDILIRLLGEETVSRMADRAGDGLDRFGHKLDATENDAKHLDRQIREVEGNLKHLATAFARTNDAADRVDITKAIRKQQTELRKLTKARDLLPDFKEEGVKSASRFAIGFAEDAPKALRGVMMGGPGAVVAGVVAAFLVPTVSAAVAGAVVGGIGIGGVVGGVALAAKDARVQAAGKQLGAHVMGDLESSASRFVSPTIRGIQIIGNAWNDVSHDVDAVFAATSRYVEPSARGIGNAVRELMPGLRKAAEAAGPIIREVSEGLPRIGRALGDVFSDFAGDANEGAAAVRYLFQVTETGIRVVGGAIHAFAQLYSVVIDLSDASATWAETMFGWLPGVGDYIKSNAAKTHELKAALDKSGDAGGQAGDKIEGGLQKVGGAATDAGVQVRSLQEIMDDFAGKTIDAEQANIRLEQAIDDAAEAAKTGAKKGIDPNTAAGRKNRQALLDIASAAREASAKILTQTGSQEQASAATERGRKKFLEAAHAMGVGKEAAIALANKLFGIPAERKPKVTVQDAQALAAIRAVKGGLATIHDRSVTVSVKYETHGRIQGEHTIGVGTNTKYQRWGGITEHAATGLLREAQTFTAASGPARYAFAEPETGGEAFIPRRGNLARSRQIWEHVGKNWLGMEPSARLGVIGGGTTVSNHYSIHVSVAAGANLAEAGRQVVEQIKAYERGSGSGWRK